MRRQLFARAGGALFGPSWRAVLAEALGVAERTVRRWEKGETDIPDRLADELVALCRERVAELQQLARELEELTK